MGKFLFRALIFTLVLVVFKLLQTLLVLNTLNSKDASNFYGINSHKPKIILVGSSNLDFNYDYKLLNETFEDYDVLGCNLNEPSGLYATIYKLKKLNPQKGDLLIFSLPHSLYEPSKFLPIGANGKKGFSVPMLKEVFREFPLRSIESLLKIKTSDTYKLFNKKVETGVEKSRINYAVATEADELPDFLSCKKLDGAFDISSLVCDKEYLLAINEFLQESFPAQIVFRFPVVKESEFVISQERLNFLSNHYDFLNNFDDSIYPDEYWYNQWYHLNYCGRKLNTEKLIEELTVHLN